MNVAKCACLFLGCLYCTCEMCAFLRRYGFSEQNHFYFLIGTMVICVGLSLNKKK